MYRARAGYKMGPMKQVVIDKKGKKQKRNKKKTEMKKKERKKLCQQACSITNLLLYKSLDSTPLV